jgi:serine/threonine-protein kinase ATR
VVENYCKALKYGTKHIYQMLPRLLTIWLDLGEQIAAEEGKKKRAR